MASNESTGHVDTWTAWIDGANTAVIQAVDWIGNDAYAYFEGKGIDNGAANDAYWGAVERVRAVSQGKPVWTTETGWPINGAAIGGAQPSISNLQIFWWQVVSIMMTDIKESSANLEKACASKSSLNFFWYILVRTVTAV